MSDHRDELVELARRLGAERVLGALADEHASTPPAHARAELLRRVAGAPRRTVPAATPVELFGARAGALRELLDDLELDDWERPAAPYRWTVHGLIAHLLVIERYAAAQLGLARPDGDDPLDDAAGHLELGAGVIAAELAADPRATASRWWSAVRSTLEHARSDAFVPDRPTPLHGWPFSSGSALVARSFEIWTHADDVRRATGRPLDVPPAGELRAMSSLSVGSLPLVVPAVRPGTVLPPVRVVLTGAGGGVYDLDGTDSTDGDLLLSLDVVDYCRMAARRREPADIEIFAEGPADAVPALWAAARAFAV